VCEGGRVCVCVCVCVSADINERDEMRRSERR
jgi:hypothetical protein